MRNTHSLEVPCQPESTLRLAPPTSIASCPCASSSSELFFFSTPVLPRPIGPVVLDAATVNEAVNDVRGHNCPVPLTHLLRPSLTSTQSYWLSGAVPVWRGAPRLRRPPAHECARLHRDPRHHRGRASGPDLSGKESQNPVSLVLELAGRAADVPEVPDVLDVRFSTAKPCTPLPSREVPVYTGTTGTFLTRLIRLRNP